MPTARPPAADKAVTIKRRRDSVVMLEDISEFSVAAGTVIPSREVSTLDCGHVVNPLTEGIEIRFDNRTAKIGAIFQDPPGRRR